MSAHNLFNLQGKSILITGSSQGLGLALARGLGEAGAQIILNGRDKGKLENVTSSLVQDNIKAISCAFDVTNEKEIISQIRILYEKIDHIDVLINNAGIQIRKPLEDFDETSWDQLLGINLKGAFLAAKAIVPKMIGRKSGKIINICSIQSELGRPTVAPYAASKGGLKMLTRAMATEWGKYNIQVNGLGPGYFETAMTKPLVEDPEFNAWLCSRTPANRWGKPEELVGPAIFLASDASGYVNGHVLYVDGGMLACV